MALESGKNQQVNSLREKGSVVLSSWLRKIHVLHIPPEILDLILNHLPVLVDLKWSKKYCGKEVQHVTDEKIKYTIDNGPTHSVALVDYIIRKSEWVTHVPAIQYSPTNPVNDSDVPTKVKKSKKIIQKFPLIYEIKMKAVGVASWNIGIVKYPLTFRGAHQSKSQSRDINKRECFDDCCIGRLFAIDQLGLDLGNRRINGTPIPKGLAKNDSFQFMVCFGDDIDPTEAEKSENSTTEENRRGKKKNEPLKTKSNNFIRIFHNRSTDCGVWENIPDVFVPAVCTRSGNMCVVNCLELQDIKCLNMKDSSAKEDASDVTRN